MICKSSYNFSFSNMNLTSEGGAFRNTCSKRSCIFHGSCTYAISPLGSLSMPSLLPCKSWVFWPQVTLLTLFTVTQPSASTTVYCSLLPLSASSLQSTFCAVPKSNILAGFGIVKTQQCPHSSQMNIGYIFQH